MGWAVRWMEKLRAGETVKFRPHGNSMRGRIESGQLVTVIPVADLELQVDDIVLCKVHGADYLHLIKAIRGEQFLIGNNRGKINGWIGRTAIYGKCIAVED